MEALALALARTTVWRMRCWDQRRIQGVEPYSTGGLGRGGLGRADRRPSRRPSGAGHSSRRIPDTASPRLTVSDNDLSLWMRIIGGKRIATSKSTRRVMPLLDFIFRKEMRLSFPQICYCFFLMWEQTPKRLWIKNKK
jgi:hypothetical protein